MAKDRLNDFALFYQEIPYAHDYLSEAEIDDFVEADNPEHLGLNADQVSLLARDMLSSQAKSDRPSSESDDLD